jgi:hypothetical protein
LFSFFTPFITKSIDFKYGYVFAGCNFVAGIGVYLFVIEGQGRTIEEIDTMYLLGVKPWESARWVMPDLDQADPKVKQRLAQSNEASKMLSGRPEGNGGVRAEENGGSFEEKKNTEDV